MCYGGGPTSLTVGRLLDVSGWSRFPVMPCHNGKFLKVKRYFTGYDGVVGVVKKDSLKQDTYYLTYTDGHH